MEISKLLKDRLEAPKAEAFAHKLMSEFVLDAKERNPDVTSGKMLTQLARPKYNEAIKELNKELESLKIINRRTDA